MTKKIENFIDNIIEEKKAQFKGMMGKEHKLEDMVESFKKIDLPKEKLEKVIEIAKRYI